MPQSPDKTDTSNTSSISKAFSILSTFNEYAPEQRTSDIAKKLGLNISTVSRHLNTMLDWNLVERDNITGFYRPGSAIIALAGLTLQNNNLYRHGASEIQYLAHEYNIHSHMGMPQGTDVIHLVNSCSKSTMELLIPIGYRHPMYCSAMGRAIMSHLPDDRVQQILKHSELVHYTPETKITPQQIMQELAISKQRGYCLMLNELIPNKGSLAIPIFDRHREPIGAISVSGGTTQLLSREAELARSLSSVARRISGRLGYFPK